MQPTEIISKQEEFIKVLQHYNLVDMKIVQEKFKIVCPFHGDINASLQINLDRGNYFCYGCGATGYALDFVKGMEQCDQLKAMMVLGKILSGKKSKTNAKPIIVKEKQFTKEEGIEQAKLYYESLSDTDWFKIKNNYIFERGFSKEVLTKVHAKINQNTDYPIIFPMLDNGVFQGYVCRTSNKETEAHRKYLYNKGFTRRDTLVGDYRRKWVIICEGYLDWLMLRQFGLKNVCAILGWKITKEQTDKLKKVTRRVISALDNDKYGKEGTEYLKQQGFKVIRFPFPKKAKDPGDMSTKEFDIAWANVKEQVMGYKVKRKK